MSNKFNIEDRVKVESYMIQNIIGIIKGYYYDWYLDRFSYIILLDSPLNEQKALYVLESGLIKI